MPRERWRNYLRLNPPPFRLYLTEPRSVVLRISLKLHLLPELVSGNLLPAKETRLKALTLQARPRYTVLFGHGHRLSGLGIRREVSREMGIRAEEGRLAKSGCATAMHPYLFVALSLSLPLRCMSSLSLRRLISAVRVKFFASSSLDTCVA